MSATNAKPVGVGSKPNRHPQSLERLYEIAFKIASTSGMTRFLFFLIISVFSFQAVGQQNICLADISSTGGQIIQRIKSEGFASLTMTNKRTGRKYQGYRICEHHYIQIDSLNRLLNDAQIDTLLACENGTLKTVGFILYSKRHNTKEQVVKKLKELLNQEYIVMTGSCSDAISMSSLGRFNYGLLTQANFLFKPNFKLTKKDKALIDLDLAYYELPMTSK